MNPPTPPPPASPAGGPWARFRHRHLFDYTPAALRLWLGVAAAGTAALAWALATLAGSHATAAWPVLAGLIGVALAACFPVQIPRSTHTVLVADVFIYTLLAALGAPAAVLAAGLEGLIGALRSSRRLSTHVSAPAAAMAAMAVGAAVYTALHAGLVQLGVAPEVAGLAALCLTSPVPVALTTGSLMSMIVAKQGRWLSLRDWFGAATWIAAMALGSAFVAGLVYLNAQRFGPAVFVIAAALVAAMVVLLRLTLQRLDRERQAQEERVSEAQHEAELSQQRFTAAFTHAAIGMAIVRPDGAMVQVNNALCALLGRHEIELLHRPFAGLLHEGDAPLFQRRADSVLAQPEQAFSMELRCDARDGSELWVVLHCSRYADPGGAGDGLILQLHDITSRHIAESRLHHIAYHDGLTDLANRTCFHERLEVAVERTAQDAGERFAVLFLDLDRFKIVNDSLGHMAGNELLREVAQRLRACVRPGDLVARLGGDEFAILLDHLHDTEVGMRLAQRVLATLSLPVALSGTEVVPAASIGITFSDLGYRNVDEVLRDADLAMYEAKAGGRGRVALFDSSMHARVAEKLALEADLRRAIGEGQLTVQFQPMFQLEPYRLYGFEALARWTHPQRGPVNPSVFIALAEETGRIDQLTDWVIEHAASQLAEWQRHSPATARLGMHVNISGRDMLRPDLAPYVQQVLQRHAISPGTLTLEITETTLMGKLEMALQTMGRLQEAGVRFSIDDFGTGYSSLAYLGTLPIDSLKIDRSFVMGLHEQPQNVEIVRAVLNLAHSLNRKVIAEGVETAEQLATLRRLGVPYGQGYLLSRPLRAEQVLELLAVTVPA
jgi:diguanylate cyclase (GGDEF)-like protein/PAS domain S-box-containing protein